MKNRNQLLLILLIIKDFNSEFVNGLEFFDKFRFKDGVNINEVLKMIK